jgi:hypothetical protein
MCTAGWLTVPPSQLSLVAHQFSSFIMLVGRIASATLFDPKYVIISVCVHHPDQAAAEPGAPQPDQGDPVDSRPDASVHRVRTRLCRSTAVRVCRRCAATSRPCWARHVVELSSSSPDLDAVRLLMSESIDTCLERSRRLEDWRRPRSSCSQSSTCSRGMSASSRGGAALWTGFSSAS